MTSKSAKALACAALLLVATGAGLLASAMQGPDRPADPAAPLAIPGVLGPDRILWSGCQGWRVNAEFLPGAAPGPRPEGWEPNTDGMTTVEVEGFRCDSFATTDVERGPVHLIVEGHSNARPPDACADADHELVRIVTGVWVDDAEVADLLAVRHGMPASLADIKSTTEGPAAAPSERIEWTLGTAEPSSVAILHGIGSAAADDAISLFWPTSRGLGRLLLDIDADGGQAALPAVGRFHDPMLLASVNGGLFAGPGHWIPRLDAAGTLQGFADAECGATA